MKIRLAAFVAILAVLPVVSAFAESIEENRLGVGLRTGYAFIPDAFLGIGFKEYESVSAPYAGIQADYGFTNFDLVVGLDNYWLSMKDGVWLQKGKSEDEDRYDVTSDFALVNADASILWKWRPHPAVEPVLGAGFSLGYPYGDLTVDRYHNGEPRNKPQDKQLPAVIPSLKLQTGCRFYPAPNFRLSVDLGLQYGFYVGLGANYIFDL